MWRRKSVGGNVLALAVPRRTERARASRGCSKWVRVKTTFNKHHAHRVCFPLRDKGVKLTRNGCGESSHVRAGSGN
eukprot:4257029-Pleurochrysis_carterae.AAC.1